MSQTDILTKMPSDIILLIFESLHSFPDLNALIRTSSRLEQIWSQNVSSIVNALMPTISDYMPLAEDLLAVQNLGYVARGTFACMTAEKACLDNLLRFITKARQLLQDLQPTALFFTSAAHGISDLDLMRARVQDSMANLSPALLAMERTVMVGRKSVADIALLNRVKQLLANEREIRAMDEIFHESLGFLLCEYWTPLNGQSFMEIAYQATISNYALSYRLLAYIIDTVARVQLPFFQGGEFCTLCRWLQCTRRKWMLSAPKHMYGIYCQVSSLNPWHLEGVDFPSGGCTGSFVFKLIGDGPAWELYDDPWFEPGDFSDPDDRDEGDDGEIRDGEVDESTITPQTKEENDDEVGEDGKDEEVLLPQW